MSSPRPRANTGKPSTASVFTKPGQDKALTHERLAEDIAAFRKAGGKVEVLGHTPLRRNGETPITPVIASKGTPRRKA
ncbi:hypothetical protein IP93_02426 [Lysobacter ruishenii]|uniref:Uncharacterized protein n=1 Tax=Aerolutibacter ruishenii TaxID=686800 RepID=A0A562LKN3_9GAMM|nr:hypothetical protein IP93_02426 [Lysobacter ruishenii]